MRTRVSPNHPVKFFTDWYLQAGKSTLATIVGRVLNWDVIDTDRILEERQHMFIQSFVEQCGLEVFRKAESEILADALLNNKTEKVIACSSGVIESKQNRQLIAQFREYGLVIHVLREKVDILEYVHKSKNCPSETDASSSWEERLDPSLFRECCSFEFASLTVPSSGNPDQPVSLKPVEEDFFRFLRFVHGVEINKVEHTVSC